MAEGRKEKKIHTPFYFGGAASCLAVLFTHPMDLLKVRLQTAKGHGEGFVHVISSIVKNQGINGFYKGLSASLLRQATYSTVRFGVYEESLKVLKRPDGTVSNFASIFSGMLGGAIGGVFGNPADVANVRMQNDGSLPLNQQRKYKGVLDALFRMVREEGPRSLLVGVTPNITRGILVTGSQVGTYDIFKKILVKQGMDPANISTHFSCSVLAALVATTVCNPVDVAKTRIMNSSTKLYSSLGDALLTISRTEGPMALFKGWTPSFLRLGPQTVLVFVFLEQFKSVYLKYHNG
ncbi:Mitochondrial dicarboxylate transporter [Smittium mucronatum]|uniref:Mitochondrial dicarboxylate transporter n=1 Tax=Smittium mucronatum TaxID=133383 RepID=A0A1R0GLC6_9FUNG|nr:Mitochondrial dicarboxylate transporter [Smittium mucronatum]